MHAYHIASAAAFNMRDQIDAVLTDIDAMILDTIKELVTDYDLSINDPDFEDKAAPVCADVQQVITKELTRVAGTTYPTDSFEGFLMARATDRLIKHLRDAESLVVRATIARKNETKGA